MPTWASREEIRLVQDNKIWFLGIAEARTLNAARKNSEDDAKRNLVEFLSGDVRISGQSKLTETDSSSKAQAAMFTTTSTLSVPIKGKRQHIERRDDMYVVYFDISIDQSDVPEIKKSATEPEAHSDLGMNPDFVTKDKDPDPTFAEKHNLLYWMPVLSNGMTAYSIGYELSFFKRRFSLEYHFIGIDETDKSFDSGKNGYHYEKKGENNFDLNFGVFKRHNQVLQLSIGMVSGSEETGYENSGIKNEVRKSDWSGLSTGLKYKATAGSSDTFGYILQLKGQQLKDKKNGIEQNRNEIYFGAGVFIAF